MPADLLLANVLGLHDLAALSALYDVSPAAMQRRLAALGPRRYVT